MTENQAFFVSRLPPANMSIVAQVCFFLRYIVNARIEFQDSEVEAGHTPLCIRKMYGN
ncbi:hypothetical protein OROGR_028228 [Orobanche gracilis]